MIRDNMGSVFVRCGQAALFGCGCWAENDLKGKVGVGVSTSGMT